MSQQQVAAAQPQRPTLRQGGGRAKASQPPDPTTQLDRHTTLGGLLLRAERAPDSLERLLAVTRVALCLATDLLRPGSRGFADTPTVVLGQHYLSRRQLAEKHRGDAMQLFLQELCSHEPLRPTQHAKYAAPASGGGGAHGSAGSAQAGSASGAVAVSSSGVGPAPVAATLSLRLRPSAAAKQQQAGGLLGLAGGAKPEDGTPPVWVEVAFEGEATLVFPRHAESYSLTFPDLVLSAPLAEACPLDFSGSATVSCEATGLTASLQFRPFKGGQLRGTVLSLLGEGQQEVAAIGGSWQSTVTAESAEGSGVLFDATQFRPPISLTANLAEPGPRAATRLWVAVVEALAYVDAAAAAREGKRAAELAAALPPHLRHSLLYEVESSGLKPKPGAEDDSSAAASAEASNPVAGVLPPCVQEHHSVHGGLAYQLHYRVQAA